MSTVKPKYIILGIIILLFIGAVISTLEINLSIENRFFDYLLVIKKGYLETILTTYFKSFELIIKQ